MSFRRLLPFVLALVASLGLALPVKAGEPVVLPPRVDLFGCEIFVEGKWLVPRRTDIDLVFRWGSETRRQGLKFLLAARPVVKIDGVVVPHPNRYWQLPVDLGDFWDTSWVYPTGRQLLGGESFVVTFQLKLREAVWDGDILWEAGKLFDPPLECKVKAPRA